MRHIKSYILIIMTAMVLGITGVHAQSKQPKQTLDLFCGAGLSYSDTHFARLYDVLLNLTPGVKLNLGNDWQIAGQALIPVVNDYYGEEYDRVRLSMAVLSKQLHLWDTQHFKLSAGLFSQERIGFDLKWMYPVTDWLAFNAQVGYTGVCKTSPKWECYRLDRLSFLGGTNVFLGKWNTEFRAYGGRYIYGDYAVLGEVMRHFKYCTVSLFGQIQQKGARNVSGSKKNGGFKFVWMLPPYKKSSKRVRIRPASNFRQVYRAHSDDQWVKTYKTDPEENEREGNFNPEKVRWGANLIGIGGNYGTAK